MQKEAAMNKDEILEKSRRDNDGMDERFKLRYKTALGAGVLVTVAVISVVVHHIFATM